MAPRLRGVPSNVIPDKSFNLFKKLALIFQRFCKMADKKKEASGSTGLEADVDACNISKNEMEWWHPARRFASDRCTNCGVELEQEDDSGANNNNSDSFRSSICKPNGRQGRLLPLPSGALLWYRGEVLRRVARVLWRGEHTNTWRFREPAQFSMCCNAACQLIYLSFIMDYYFICHIKSALTNYDNGHFFVFTSHLIVPAGALEVRRSQRILPSQCLSQH